jgi:hypothetical protein
MAIRNNFVIVLDNTEGAIENGQFRENGHSKHNTLCVGHHYTQINTKNVNKT